MLGGHYTYARVPLGFWMQEAFGFARNHYDRIGHLAQGFVPAIVAREVLLRQDVARAGRLALLPDDVRVPGDLGLLRIHRVVDGARLGTAATDFLGTQGDPWDTQWDMFLAFVGAVSAQLLFSRVQERQLAALNRRENAGLGKGT